MFHFGGIRLLLRTRAHDSKHKLGSDRSGTNRTRGLMNDRSRRGTITDLGPSLRKACVASSRSGRSGISGHGSISRHGGWWQHIVAGCVSVQRQLDCDLAMAW